MKKIFLVILFVNFLYSTDQIQPLTEQWIPYQIETKDGLKGISIDLVREIQKRIGNTKEIKVFPWKRGYNITLQKEGYALFLTTKSKKREPLFKWVGPISSMKIAFFKNSFRTDLNINSIEDAKNVSSIVVAENTISHEILSKMNFKNLHVNTLANNAFPQLVENKVDLYPVEYDAFLYKLKKLKLEKKIVPVKMKPFFESELYIAFNKNTNDKTIKLWQDTLDSIKNDGTYKKIVENYR